LLYWYTSKSKLRAISVDLPDSAQIVPDSLALTGVSPAEMEITLQIQSVDLKDLQNLIKPASTT